MIKSNNSGFESASINQIKQVLLISIVLGLIDFNYRLQRITIKHNEYCFIISPSVLKISKEHSKDKPNATLAFTISNHYYLALIQIYGNKNDTI